MRLSVLRGELKRELSTDEARKTFDNARKTHGELQRHPTIFSVLSVLASRRESGYQAQQQILRVLVTEAQGNPEQRIWRQALLYAFLPSLVRIRAGTIQGNHRAEDLDGALWTAFLEIVHGYPLHRKGSLAANIKLDTRKRFYKTLRREQETQRRYFDLVSYADSRIEPDKPETYNFNPADHQEPAPEAPLSADDLREMRSALDRCDGVSPADIDLIWATEVEGQTIRQFMDARGLATGDQAADDQTFQRLKKRRQRIKKPPSGAPSPLREALHRRRRS